MKRQVLRLLPFLLILIALAAAGPGTAAGSPPDGPPGLVRALLAQQRHTDALMARPEVLGTGVGEDANGDWVVVVFTDRPGVAGLPGRLDGSVGVEARVTGPIYASAPAPTDAAFTFTCSGLACSFDASSSATRGGTTYSWAFGDGNNGSGKTVNHTFAAASSYEVTLTVTASQSGTDSETKTVTVSGSSGGGGTDCAASGDTATRCLRPVPIGVSVGHPGITAGTLGARATTGSGGVVILSNNHVLANSNAASIGDSALQPGPYDGGQDPADLIGQLADFQPITFNSTTSTNIMDAAIAATTTANVGSSTHLGGYGAPGASTATAFVGMAVRKQGRTTGDTTGVVSAINVTVDVCYAGVIMCSTYARFVDQIAIGSDTFSAGGDSGSLIVTDDSQHSPVALLFAGSSTTTFGSPIDPILSRFDMQIDGAATGQPPLAEAGGPYAATEDVAVALDGSFSSDPDGDTLSYSWDFGDGSTGTGATPAHTYLWGGSFTITLEVFDGNGNSSTDTASVTVAEVNDVPVADAGGPYAGVVGASVSFDGSGTTDFDNLDGTAANDQALTFSWDFGDGGVGSGQVTSHTYAAAGDYVVTLTVGDGQSVSIDTAPVSVVETPAGVTVTSVSPSTMTSGTTAAATIYGSGFAPGATVTFASGEGPAPIASSVVVAGDGTSLTLVIQAKAGGPPRTRFWDVIVTNPDAASGTLSAGLTVTP